MSLELPSRRAVLPTADHRPDRGPRLIRLKPKLATPSAPYTGLTVPNAFYFGNAVGESRDLDANAEVNGADVLLARNNPHNFFNPATLTCPYDYNHDARVNATDVLIACSTPTDSETALKLIHPPALEGEGQDEGALMPASVEAAPASSAIGPDAPLGKWAWPCEFEQTSTQSQPSEKHNPAAEAVDIVATRQHLDPTVRTAICERGRSRQPADHR